MLFDKSPYIDKKNRLADVIAAIQVLGTFRSAARSVEKWEKTIGRRPASAKSWREVFKAHPEFFRFKNDQASLVWRRARDKTRDTKTGVDYSRKELALLSPEEKNELKRTRAKLDDSQVETLLQAAIQLHATALAHRRESRWWVPLVATIVGIFLGPGLSPSTSRSKRAIFCSSAYHVSANSAKKNRLPNRTALIV